MKALFYISILLTGVLNANAQNLPIDNCICTAYGISDVYINKEGDIEVSDFNSDYKIFSTTTGVLLGRTKKTKGKAETPQTETFAYSISSNSTKKGTTYKAIAQQSKDGNIINNTEKELFAKGDKFYLFEYRNNASGMAFVTTKHNLFFISPYRIDTLTNGKSSTTEFFKNIGSGFHPDHISPSSYALYKKDVGAVLTKTGVLINAKGGIIGDNYPKPRIDGTYQQKYYKFWPNKPFLTYEATNQNIVTLNYETGEIVRIITVPQETLRLFRDLQKIPPTFNIINDRQFLIFASQYSPNSYVWYYNNGQITPLCDAASKDEYADAKKRSDAFYEWQRKDQEAQRQAKEKADAQWYKDNTVTKQQCTACGGKGGTSVENANSASGVGYRSVYETDGFGNKKYVTSNYGKTFYPCKRCNGTGQQTVKKN